MTTSILSFVCVCRQLLSSSIDIVLISCTMLAAITLYTDKFPILTVQKGCNKLCYAFPLRGVDADKNVRTLGEGGSQKRTRAYKGGEG